MIGILAIGAAGCANKGKIDPLAGGGGLAGSWVSSDNVFTASFSAGEFVATANDTGGVISEGRYIVASASEVRLDWRGKITGVDNSAVCQRPSPEQLNCTDATGKTFTLIKRMA